MSIIAHGYNDDRFRLQGGSLVLCMTVTFHAPDMPCPLIRPFLLCPVIRPREINHVMIRPPPFNCTRDHMNSKYITVNDEKLQG